MTPEEAADGSPQAGAPERELSETVEDGKPSLVGAAYGKSVAAAAGCARPTEVVVGELLVAESAPPAVAGHGKSAAAEAGCAPPAEVAVGESSLLAVKNA